MSLVVYAIPMIIAGIIFRIICKFADINSNYLLVIMIIAVAAAEYFFTDLQDMSEPIGLGFAAAIAFNIFKVRTDTEVKEVETETADTTVS